MYSICGFSISVVSASSNMIFLLIVIFVLFRLSSRRFVVTTSNRISQLTTSPCLQRNATMVILIITLLSGRYVAQKQCWN